MTIRKLSDWLVSTFTKASGTFGNVAVTAVHDDRGRMTGITLRKKTVIRSDAGTVRSADYSADRIDRAVVLLNEHFSGLREARGDGELFLEVMVQGGAVRQVSVMETRNLSGGSLDADFPGG